MDEEQKKKIFLVKIGVVSVMIIILALWFLNLKNFFAPEPGHPVDNEKNWTEVKDEFQDMTVDLSAKISQLQNKEEGASGDALLKGLMDRASRLATSSTSTLATSSVLAGQAATTSASVKAPKDNCPAYIDCMPTIGEPKPCQVPAGCEGITQIAY